MGRVPGGSSHEEVRLEPWGVYIYIYIYINTCIYVLYTIIYIKLYIITVYINPVHPVIGDEISPKAVEHLT